MFENEIQNFENHFQSFIQDFYSGNNKLHEACRYALEGKGKRLRPLLVMLTHKIFSENISKSYPAALAVEMIHTYSLVHDDLPLMDNDDYRRGRLTVHKVYDEATALLVGDALLSDAFLCLTEVAQFRELAQAIGSCGMVYGQSLDIQWTAKTGYTFEDLKEIHRNKTGKLFAASCALGALTAGASKEDVESLRAIGEKFGWAYQIIDDLIDDDKNTGKSSGKDKSSGKLTYLSVMSRQDAVACVEKIFEEIRSALRKYGDKAKDLEKFTYQFSNVLELNNE